MNYPHTKYPLLLLINFILMGHQLLAQQKRVFKEKRGLVAVEAENYTTQEKDGIRKWYLVNNQVTPSVQPDGDENHSVTASGNAYLEILPDTRRTHDDKLTQGVNFSGKAGEMAVLSYWIKFKTIP